MSGYYLFSYIDPGVGAMVLQVVAAAILTGGIYFRRALLFPLSFLRGKMGRTNRIDEQEVDVDESTNHTPT